MVSPSHEASCFMEWLHCYSIPDRCTATVGKELAEFIAAVTAVDHDQSSVPALVLYMCCFSDPSPFILTELPFIKRILLSRLQPMMYPNTGARLILILQLGLRSSLRPSFCMSIHTVKVGAICLPSAAADCGEDCGELQRPAGSC